MIHSPRPSIVIAICTSSMQIFIVSNALIDSRHLLFNVVCTVIRSFAVIHCANQSNPHAVAFHPASCTRTHAHACTRTYAPARDIYPDAASNDFTLPSSNRAALRLSFSIIGPPGVTHYPPVRQNPLSDPNI